MFGKAAVVCEGRRVTRRAVTLNRVWATPAQISRTVMPFAPNRESHDFSKREGGDPPQSVPCEPGFRLRHLCGLEEALLHEYHVL